jgi:hypothetical protein
MNEFVIKNGFRSQGNSEVTGSLNVTGGITGSINPSGSNVFAQGGNSFATQALLGTNDNQSLALETSGSIRMFISSSGNIGMGTPTPLASLHISGSSGSALLEIDSPAVNNILFVSGSGNVGINTGTPTAPLHVAFNSTLSAGINIDASGNTVNHIAFMRNSVVYGRLGVNASSGEFRWDSPAGNYFPTIYSNGVEAMRIATTQNVLIGTTTDAGFKLDVSGTARTTGQHTVGTLGFTGGGSTISSIGNSYINFYTRGFRGFDLYNGSATAEAQKVLIGNFATFGVETSRYTAAMLVIESTTKGFLPPRTSATSNISSPGQGLITYVVTSSLEGLYYYNSGSYEGWTRVLNTTGSQSISGSLTVVGTSNLGGATFSNGGATFSNNVNLAAINEGSGNSWVNLNTTRVHLGQNGSTGGLNVTAATQFVGVGKMATAQLDILGNTLLTGSLSITSSAGTGSAIYAYKSGSTVLDIQGSQGQLFSVIDALSGSLMSVNDVSGLPILEVFSDDRVVMGTYGAPALTVSGSAVTVATASAAPTGTVPEGTFRFATVGGAYFIYAYLGGAWRSGSLF